MRFSRVLLLFASGMVAIGAGMGLPVAPAAAQDAEVARVDGVVITEEDLAIALEDIGNTIPQMSEQERRDYLIAYLADVMNVANAAREDGLADEPNVARRMDYLVKRQLMELYLAREGRAAANETAAKELYDEVIKDVPEEPRIRARHILVDTEEEAKAIRQALEDGGDFAELAKEKSGDPGSGSDGGDLGWFTKEEMVPEFAEAAFALEPGQISDPVKSDFGWHIIKVEGARTKPGFDEVETEIYDMLVRQRQLEIITALRDAVEIERLDKAADDGEDEARKGNRKKRKTDGSEDADATEEPQSGSQ